VCERCNDISIFAKHTHVRTPAMCIAPPFLAELRENVVCERIAAPCVLTCTAPPFSRAEFARKMQSWWGSDRKKARV